MATQREDLQRRLECPLCFEVFDSHQRLPKGLPCLHNMCLPCLRALETPVAHRISCPICRKQHTVPTNLADLPNNPVIMELVDEHEKSNRTNLQSEMRNTLEESSPLLEEYSAKMHMGLVAVKKQNESLRKSSEQTKQDLKQVFGICIDQLSQRLNDLLPGVDERRKTVSDAALALAKVKMDEASGYLATMEHLMSQTYISPKGFKAFNVILNKIAYMSHQTEDRPPSIWPTFDWGTTLDNIDSFGKVECSHGKIDWKVPLTKDQRLWTLEDDKLALGKLVKSLEADNETMSIQMEQISADKQSLNRILSKVKEESKIINHKLVFANAAKANFSKLSTGLKEQVKEANAAKEDIDRSLMKAKEENKTISHALAKTNAANAEFNKVNTDLKTKVKQLEEDLAKLHKKEQNRVTTPAMPAARAPRDHRRLVKVQEIGSEGSGRGQFCHPWGIAVTPTGNMIVADTWNHRMVEIDTEGHVVLELVSHGQANGQFEHPARVAIDSLDNRYVTSQHKVQIFDSRWRFLSTFGCEGIGNCQFSDPRGIALDPVAQRIYISDQGNSRICVHTMHGVYKKSFGSNLKSPEDIVLHKGHLYVSDIDLHHIVVYTPMGHQVRTIGRMGQGLGEFMRPCGMSIDSYGTLIVCEGDGNRVHFLSASTGTAKRTLDCQYEDDLLIGPVGVALATDGSLVVVNHAKHCLEVFN